MNGRARMIALAGALFVAAALVPYGANAARTSGSTVIELTPPFAESFSVNRCDGAGVCTAEATADKTTGSATVRGTTNGTADGTASANPLAMIKQPFTGPRGASSATFTVTVYVESAEAQKSLFGSQADVRLLAGVGDCCAAHYSEQIVDADPWTPTPSFWGPARSHTFTFTFDGALKGRSQIFLGLQGVANVGSGTLAAPYAQVQAAVKFTQVTITFSG